jgi:hypothetical protein
MTAVTIDISVVDGSNTTITPNPLFPMQVPVDIADLADGTLSAPVNITFLASDYIITPINIAGLLSSVISAPTNITEINSSNILAPIDLTDAPPVDMNAPVNIADIPSVDLSTPINITDLSALSLPIPLDITELNPSSIDVPIDIAEVSAVNLSAPVVITELSPINIDAPVDITDVAVGTLSTPVNITELSPANISLPIGITELSAGVVSPPVDITELAVSVVDVPVDIPEVAAADVAIPINITAVAAATLAVPTVITANALDPEVPPFSLKHARILYLNKLIGSAVTTSLGTNGSLVLIPNTADRWAINTTSFITFTLPAAVSIDTIGIGAHNLGSTNYVISFQYSVTDVSSFVTFKPAQTPADDTAVMSHISSSVSARRVRIILTGSGSAFVGSIYAGIALQMQRPFFAGHSPLPLSARTVRYSSVTEGGNFVGEQIRRLGFRTSAPFKNLSNDWYRLYFQPFVIHARTLPFYFAWNLDQYPTDVGYCKTNEDITPAYGSLDMFNVSFDMVGFG